MSIGRNTHICIRCGWVPGEGYDSCLCSCGGELIGKSPGVIFTRDSFGIGRKFVHTNEDGSQKEITTWKEWERAGYRDAKDYHTGERLQMIKAKEKQIKKKKITVEV